MNKDATPVRFLLASWPFLLGAVGLGLGWLISAALASNNHIVESRETKSRVSDVEQAVGELQGFERENLQAHSQILVGQESLKQGQESIQQTLESLR